MVQYYGLTLTLSKVKQRCIGSPSGWVTTTRLTTWRAGDPVTIGEGEGGGNSGPSSWVAAVGSTHAGTKPSLLHFSIFLPAIFLSWTEEQSSHAQFSSYALSFIYSYNSSQTEFIYFTFLYEKLINIA